MPLKQSRSLPPVFQPPGGAEKFAKRCAELAAQGLSKAHAAVEMGIADSTFRRWLPVYAPDVKWSTYQRTPEHLAKHAERVRAKAAESGRSVMVDVGDGEGPSSLRQVALRHGLAYSVVYRRYRRGWPPAQLVAQSSAQDRQTTK